MKIAWIGTGKMGGYMAGNLAKNGFAVIAWNRTSASDGMKTAVSAGCTEATSLGAALDGACVVFSCVSDAAALGSVLSAVSVKSLRPGIIVVDCSTIGPAAAKTFAAHLSRNRLRFVDAPVTGGDVGAKNATLTFMVGGNDADIESVKPLLLTMGKKIVHAGAVGCGQALKLVNQLLCAENLLAVGEAFEAARGLGLPPELVVSACSGGAAASWQLTNLGPKVASDDDNPGFKVAHMSKDLNLLRDTLDSDAENMICFPLVAQAFAILKNSRFQMAEKGTQALALNLKEIHEMMTHIPS